MAIDLPVDTAFNAVVCGTVDVDDTHALAEESQT
jgi:hypothetical protein